MINKYISKLAWAGLGLSLAGCVHERHYHDDDAVVFYGDAPPPPGYIVVEDRPGYYYRERDYYRDYPRDDRRAPEDRHYDRYDAGQQRNYTPHPAPVPRPQPQPVPRPGPPYVHNENNRNNNQQ